MSDSGIVYAWIYFVSYFKLTQTIIYYYKPSYTVIYSKLVYTRIHSRRKHILVYTSFWNDITWYLEVPSYIQRYCMISYSIGCPGFPAWYTSITQFIQGVGIPDGSCERLGPAGPGRAVPSVNSALLILSNYWLILRNTNLSNLWLIFDWFHTNFSFTIRQLINLGC